MVIFYLTNDVSRSEANQAGTDLLKEAAEFGLISNLISIVCRFIFQPMEEIAYNLFSKLPKKNEKLIQDPPSEDANNILVQYLSIMMGIGISAIMFS